MLIKTTKEYNRRINEIIEGDFDSEILKVSEASKLRDVFKELSVYNFSNIKVLKCELLGQEVLSYLLNTFSILAAHDSQLMPCIFNFISSIFLLSTPLLMVWLLYNI